MTPKISTDDMERVLDYLITSYNNGLHFHKTHYMEDKLAMPSKKIAKVLEKIKSKKEIILEKYSRKAWYVKGVGK
jgi:hypothetical protein